MVENLNLDTSKIREGDVVLTCGMRVLIDGEMVERRDGPSGRTVYHYSGLVQNVDEVREMGLVPISWLYPDVFRGGWTKDWDAEPRWTVQGNDLAHWVVERSV